MSERGLILDLPLYGTLVSRPPLGRTISAYGSVAPTPTYMQCSPGYISIPAAEVTGLPTSTGTFAVELEFKTTSNPSPLSGMLSWGGGDSSGVLVGIASGGTVRFTASNVTQYSAAAKNDGKWHHVLATYDGVNNLLFVDGALEAQSAATGNLVSSAVHVGTPAWYTSYSFNGQLRNVRLWSIPRFACHARLGANRVLKDKSNV